MRLMGRYSPVDCDYDIDHELNRNIEELKELIKRIDDNGNPINKKVILRELAHEIINEL